MDRNRPTPLLADIEDTRKKLETWFSRQRSTPISISALSIPEGNGMSNVTVLFDIEWQAGGKHHSQACVGRIQPAIERPVFPSYALTPQYKVMEALARHSDIPVPRLLGLETDTSVLGREFYIMERVDGKVPTDMPPYNMDGWLLHETTEPGRAQLWQHAIETMARLHCLDHESLNLDFLTVAEGSTPLQQQLNYWQNYHDWGLEGHRHPVCQPALDWLQANQPSTEPTGLCWGDSRVGNMMFAPSLDGVSAVLDWEMAVLGNPVQDLAWFNFLDATFSEGLGMPRLPGLPSYEETVRQWERAAGRPAEHYDYYVIFAGTRFGLIMSRIMLATGKSSEVETNFVSQMLQKRLDEIR